MSETWTIQQTTETWEISTEPVSVVVEISTTALGPPDSSGPGGGLFPTPDVEWIGGAGPGDGPSESTLSDEIGIYVGAGTLTLPDPEIGPPQAWVVSSLAPGLTIEATPDRGGIFDVENQNAETIALANNEIVILVRYVDVWRIMFSSASSGGGGGPASPVNWQANAFLRAPDFEGFDDGIFEPPAESEVEWLSYEPDYDDPEGIPGWRRLTTFTVSPEWWDENDPCNAVLVTNTGDSENPVWLPTALVAYEPGPGPGGGVFRRIEVLGNQTLLVGCLGGGGWNAPTMWVGDNDGPGDGPTPVGTVDPSRPASRFIPLATNARHVEGLANLVAGRQWVDDEDTIQWGAGRHVEFDAGAGSVISMPAPDYDHIGSEFWIHGPWNGAGIVEGISLRSDGQWIGGPVTVASGQMILVALVDGEGPTWRIAYNSADWYRADRVTVAPSDGTTTEVTVLPSGRLSTDVIQVGVSSTAEPDPETNPAGGEGFRAQIHLPNAEDPLLPVGTRLGYVCPVDFMGATVKQLVYTYHPAAIGDLGVAIGSVSYPLTIGADNVSEWDFDGTQVTVTVPAGTYADTGELGAALVGALVSAVAGVGGAAIEFEGYAVPQLETEWFVAVTLEGEPGATITVVSSSGGDPLGLLGLTSVPAAPTESLVAGVDGHGRGGVHTHINRDTGGPHFAEMIVTQLPGERKKWSWSIFPHDRAEMIGLAMSVEHTAFLGGGIDNVGLALARITQYLIDNPAGTASAADVTYTPTGGGLLEAAEVDQVAEALDALEGVIAAIIASDPASAWLDGYVQAGDLMAGAGVDAAARIPVGDPGEMLTPNPAVAGGLEWVPAPSGGSSPFPYYGTASDGSLTVATNQSITSSFAGFKNYGDLVVNPGVVLTVIGGILWVDGVLTLNGDIDISGGAGSAASATGGVSGPGMNGAGGTSAGGGGGITAGSAGLPTTNPLNGIAAALGGNGGAGGAGSGGAGGAAGVVPTLNGPTEAAVVDLLSWMQGRIMARNVGATFGYAGGRGGGGGGGDGSVRGPSGGGGAGFLVIFAREIVGTGRILARGGAGGANSTGTNVGGGGGGGGGFVGIVTDSDSALSITIDVSGGAGGAGRGTGVAGAAGAAGRFRVIGT